MKTYNFDELIDRTNTNCLKYDARAAFFWNADILPLWVADMDFRTPDFIVDAIKKRAEHEIFGDILFALNHTPNPLSTG